MYDRPAAGCKHIKSVLRNGCLAGPDRSAGRNDLGAVGIAIIGSVKNRGHERTRRRCAGRTAAGDRGGLGKRLRGPLDGHRRESDALTRDFSESRLRVSDRVGMAAIGDCDASADDALTEGG